MQNHFLTLLLCLFLASVVQGQSAVVAGGDNLADEGGRLSLTIGQIAFIGKSDTGGRMGEGVQRAIARITSTRDTTICSGSTLDTLEVTGQGGDWEAFSAIGTTINAAGLISAGTNSTNEVAEDTLVYIFNGYTDTVYVKSNPSLELSCTNLMLETDNQGQVHLDSLAISQGIQAAGGGSNAVVSPATPFLSCINGFQQDVSFINSDGTGCSDSCEVQVTLIDTIQPVPGCEAAGDLVLVWQGLSLFPASLSGTSTDNCGAQNLEFSFSSNFSEPSITLNCREQLELLDSVQLYMRDQSGNVSACQVFIGYEYPSGEDCACDWGNLKLKGEIPPNDYKAKDFVVALGKITMGDTVLIKAGQYIRFGPGFRVEHGSTMMARIDSCGNVPQAFHTPEEQLISGAEDHLRGAEDQGTGQLSIHTLEVFPNPFTTWFKVQMEMDSPGKVSFELHNLQGGTTYHLLQEASMETGIQEIMIDGSRLPSGMYVLTATQGSQMVSKQVMKIHN